MMLLGACGEKSEISVVVEGADAGDAELYIDGEEIPTREADGVKLADAVVGEGTELQLRLAGGTIACPTVRSIGPAKSYRLRVRLERGQCDLVETSEGIGF